MGILDALAGAVRFGQGVASRVRSTAKAAREEALATFESQYWGHQYEGKGLATPWDKVPPGARRTPMRAQRPSVQYDLPRLIVDRPTALLFGEGRFPEIMFETSTTTDGSDGASEVAKWLTEIADEGSLPSVALSWSRHGATSGTGILTWSIVEGEFEFEAHKACYCTATFHPKKRSRVIWLEKRFKFQKAIESIDPVSGAKISRDVPYWHREVWNEQSHIVFNDAPVGDGKEPSWTVADQVDHGFGFVPGVWVKNIDDGETANIDGVSLLDGLGDTFEDLDRTLSAKSRALRYNQDPERIYFGITEEERKRLEIGGGASTAMPPRKKADGSESAVQLLELQGEGQRIAEEHVVAQRGRTLEVARVTAPDPERIVAAAKSGAAIRLLFAPTLELVGEQRQTYGRALREILGQILRAAREGKLAALGTFTTPPPASIPAGKVKLQWGRFFDPTPEDLDYVARVAATLKAASLMDTETLVRWLAGFMGTKDVQAILDRLQTEKNDEAAAMAEEVRQAQKAAAAGGGSTGGGANNGSADDVVA